MSRKKTPKSYQSMDADTLAKETADFDREFAADTFSPMGATSRARWERARRNPGRPRKGKGAQAIAVTVERDLLARCDALARKLGISRAGLIARGIRAVLAAEGRL
jgi:hypothetical protein